MQFYKFYTYCQKDEIIRHKAISFTPEKIENLEHYKML